MTPRCLANITRSGPRIHHLFRHGKAPRIILHKLGRWEHLVGHKVIEIYCPVAPVDNDQSPVRETVQRQGCMLGQELRRQLGHLNAVDVNCRGNDEHSRGLASRIILQGLVQLGNGMVAVELCTDVLDKGLLLFAGLAALSVMSVRSAWAECWIVRGALVEFRLLYLIKIFLSCCHKV